MTTTPLKTAAVMPLRMATGIDALMVVREIVNAANQWVQVHETETTKRAAIGAREHIIVEQIHARRDLLLTYLDKSFDERRKTFAKLFRALDRALATDSPHVAGVLASITELAGKSPFADLQDIEMVKQNLDDPEYIWTA